VTVVLCGRKTLRVPAQNEVRYTRYYSHRMGLTVLVDPAAHDYFVATMFSVGIRVSRLLYLSRNIPLTKPFASQEVVRFSLHL
jgi:hypothetical protein